MTTRVRDVMRAVDAIAPRWLAAAGDPVGLHAGHPERRIRRVLVALDASLRAVEEAEARGCEMLVVHHPRFYRPLATLDESTPLGLLAARMVRARLAICVAHTNLDAAPGGTNDMLADLVGLDDPRPLAVHAEDRWLKLAVFVPESHREAVRAALCEAGAGVIGAYADCSFRTAGIGTFRGADGTSPFIGKAGRFEEAEEWRLEVLLSERSRDGVVTALRAAHPYEEPAFDLYPLADAHRYGCGRVGALRRPDSLRALARRLKRACRARSIHVLGEPAQRIRRAAVWAGSGVPLPAVLASQADLLVVGEVGYHDLEILAQQGLAAIVLGHGPCEEVVLPILARKLRAALKGVEIRVLRESVPPLWGV